MVGKNEVGLCVRDTGVFEKSAPSRRFGKFRWLAPHAPGSGWAALEAPVRVDGRAGTRWDALGCAAAHGQADCLLALLDAGASGASTSHSGGSALHLAARDGHPACTRIHTAEAEPSSDGWSCNRLRCVALIRSKE